MSNPVDDNFIIATDENNEFSPPTTTATSSPLHVRLLQISEHVRVVTRSPSSDQVNKRSNWLYHFGSERGAPSLGRAFEVHKWDTRVPWQMAADIFKALFLTVFARFADEELPEKALMT